MRLFQFYNITIPLYCGFLVYTSSAIFCLLRWLSFLGYEVLDVSGLLGDGDAQGRHLLAAQQ